MRKFKTHMILFADSESFITLCGIDDGCSESFNDQNPLVPFGHEKETNCKKCTKRYQELLEIEKKNQEQYEKPAL